MLTGPLRRWAERYRQETQREVFGRDEHGRRHLDADQGMVGHTYSSPPRR
jgi:hypothetical protein